MKVWSWRPCWGPRSPARPSRSGTTTANRPNTTTTRTSKVRVLSRPVRKKTDSPPAFKNSRLTGDSHVYQIACTYPCAENATRKGFLKIFSKNPRRIYIYSRSLWQIYRTIREILGRRVVYVFTCARLSLTTWPSRFAVNRSPKVYAVRIAVQLFSYFFRTHVPAVRSRDTIFSPFSYLSRANRRRNPRRRNERRSLVPFSHVFFFDVAVTAFSKKARVHVQYKRVAQQNCRWPRRCPRICVIITRRWITDYWDFEDWIRNTLWIFRPRRFQCISRLLPRVTGYTINVL